MLIANKHHLPVRKVPNMGRMGLPPAAQNSAVADPKLTATEQVEEGWEYSCPISLAAGSNVISSPTHSISHAWR